MQQKLWINIPLKLNLAKLPWVRHGTTPNHIWGHQNQYHAPCLRLSMGGWVLQGNSRNGHNKEKDYQRVVKSYKSKRLKEGGKTGPEEKAALWHAVHPREVPARNSCEKFLWEMLCTHEKLQEIPVRNAVRNAIRNSCEKCYAPNTK